MQNQSDCSSLEQSDLGLHCFLKHIEFYFIIAILIWTTEFKSQNACNANQMYCVL